MRPCLVGKYFHGLHLNLRRFLPCIRLIPSQSKNYIFELAKELRVIEGFIADASENAVMTFKRSRVVETMLLARENNAPVLQALNPRRHDSHVRIFMKLLTDHPPVNEECEEYSGQRRRRESSEEEEKRNSGETDFVDVINEGPEGDGPRGHVMALESRTHGSEYWSFEASIVIHCPVENTRGEVSNHYRGANESCEYCELRGI